MSRLVAIEGEIMITGADEMLDEPAETAVRESQARLDEIWAAQKEYQRKHQDD
jgi:hypothetical protein